MIQAENVIFWGAGATAELGIRTTDGQTTFIKHVTGAHASHDKSLLQRVSEALGPDVSEYWRSALVDLITILGDTDDNYVSIDHIDDDQRSAMRRNWKEGACDNELNSRIIHLRLIYDWPALKSLVNICPGSSRDTFKLNDLFNLLDLHIPLGFGVRAPARHGLHTNESERQFFDARRLIGAKNALRMILIALFYIDWQECIRSKQSSLHHYYDIAILLGRRMQTKGIELSHQYQLDEPEFYQGDVGFVSLNYDPIALWVQFIANRYLNKNDDVPHVGLPPAPLHLFQDFGHLIPARRIGRPKADWPWYPMNEAATQRLNELGVLAPKVRLTQFLFPHGSLCWRECPDCRKLSAYHGDQWNLLSSGLFPPPPLLAFDREIFPDWISGDERNQREKGGIDARACLHCGTLTFAHHTQTVMQSSFKSPPPSFIEEIQRELRATTMHAKHIIFMGYSLPSDDVAYRALFAATCQRNKDQSQLVRCTIVGKEKDNSSWYGPTEIKSRCFSEHHTVNAAVDIFGAENVRYCGSGVPDVFLDNGKATTAKLEQLLAWDSISPSAE